MNDIIDIFLFRPSFISSCAPAYRTEKQQQITVFTLHFPAYFEFCFRGVFLREVTSIACSLDRDMTSAMTTGLHIYTFQFSLFFLDPLI